MNAMSEDTFEKSFQVTHSAKLNLSNICGSVEIYSGDGDTIQVKAIKNGHTGDGKRTQIEILQEVDGTVKAVTHFPDGGWSWLFLSRPCEVDYVVKVPHQCSLIVKTVSSTVSASDVDGTCNVKSVSGDITLHNQTGSMVIHTISGEINGEHVIGPVDLNTISGDVRLKDSRLSSIHARTVSGTLEIHTPLIDGPYQFKSISGDVHLVVPPETRCTVDLHSISGELSSAFPVLGFSQDHGNQTMNVQGGGINVTLNSVSGSLTLDSDGKILPIPATPDLASAEERRTVLEGISRGEMTLEEGLTRLKA
jgi:DUF4097 and DUF4098 domain-containing protein YvlB